MNEAIGIWMLFSIRHIILLDICWPLNILHDREIVIILGMTKLTLIVSQYNRLTQSKVTN